MEAQECAEGKYLYDVDDYVMYRRSGICRIADIRRKEFDGAEGRLYYVLKPVFDSTLTLYVPVDFSEIAQHMRRALSADDIDAIIAETEQSQNRWIDDADERAVTFERILNGGDRADILWLVKALSLHKAELRKKDRRLGDNDKKALASAEKLITDEFAFALGIEKNEVVPYILGQIKKRGEEACA